MASVTILDQTYALPAIATERFRALQEQVQAQQQAIQTGLRRQPRLLGMIPRPPRTLTPEERWRQWKAILSRESVFARRAPRTGEDEVRARWRRLREAVR